MKVEETLWVSIPFSLPKEIEGEVAFPNLIGGGDPW
jgi:hypothetical protein